MGTQRDAQDPHPGRDQKPKLSLAGRLDGFVAGQPVRFVADNRDLILHAGTTRTLFALRHTWPAIARPVRAVLTRAGIRLLVQTRWFGVVEVFPNPNYLVRLLLPRA